MSVSFTLLDQSLVNTIKGVIVINAVFILYSRL